MGHLIALNYLNGLFLLFDRRLPVILLFDRRLPVFLLFDRRLPVHEFCFVDKRQFLKFKRFFSLEREFFTVEYNSLELFLQMVYFLS